jgi:hypothetical protein
MGQTRQRMAWRLGILGIGAAAVLALGLSLLAGARVDNPAALKLFTPIDASAFLACSPAARPESQSRVTVTTHDGMTTYESQGQAHGLTKQQVLTTAECLRRRGLISTRTLAAVRRQGTAAGNLVPWWAPAAVVPNWATMLLWLLLAIAELLGAAALVSSWRRRPPESA